ncbi:MAG: threonyl-tRNA synthetase editing domain-containing protein, partial [Acidiferrobacterales bacterium]
MKLLMFQAQHFRFRSFLKTVPDAADHDVDEEISEVAVIFVHAEAEDEPRRDKMLGTALKNIKWIANKRELRNVALHSFTHLSTSRATPEFAQAFLEDLGDRLKTAGYAVWLTPFGYT